MRSIASKMFSHRRGRTLAAVALLCAVVCLVGAVGITHLWFTSGDTVKNNLAAPPPVFSVQAVDKFEKGSNPPAPGVPVNKKVGAANSGTLPCFVRLMVLPTITATGADGTPVLLPAELGKHVLLDVNTSAWACGGDGYYYYIGMLAAGASTPDLFTTVTLAADLPAEYTGATLAVEVKCEAVATAKWAYRTSWWGGEDAPAKAEWKAVDDKLKGLAQ